MKYILFSTLLALLFLTGCKSATDPSAENESTPSTSPALSGASDHTAISARDHIGLYKGLLPCADCDGIETSLYLMANNAYLLTKVYKGKDDHKTYKHIGDFEWNEEGTVVMLSNMENAPNQFIIEDTRAIQLDMAGNKIEGQLADQYVLTKQ